jgi:transcription termination factor NusB
VSAGANRKSLLRKRASRLAAAQALYGRALNQQSLSAAQMVKQITASWADSKTNEARDLPYNVQPEAPLLTRLVESALANEARIETAIEALILPGWKKSRMSLPLLATLRTCAAEALASPAKKRGMLVEEYTEIAAQLVTDDELAYAHKGFNLLLDALRSDA